MKCREESDILLIYRTLSGRIFVNCDHKFCQSCLRKENGNSTSSISHTFTCPCCHAPFHDNMQSIDEAILIGEAATLRNCVVPHISLLLNSERASENLANINEMNKAVIEKLESALLLNPTNIYTLYSLLCGCHNGQIIMMRCENKHKLEFYRLKLFDYSFRLLEHPAIEALESVKSECYYELAGIFSEYRNYPASLRYAKMAY